MTSYTKIVLFLVRPARARNWLPQKSFHFSSKVFSQYIIVTYQRSSSDIGNFCLHLWEKVDAKIDPVLSSYYTQHFAYNFLLCLRVIDDSLDTSIDSIVLSAHSSKTALQKMDDFAASSNTHQLSTKKVFHNL